MKEEESSPNRKDEGAGLAESPDQLLLAKLDRLTTEAARHRGEVAELRERLLRMEDLVTACGLPDDDSAVRRKLLELFCDALVEGRDLELDEGLKRRRTARRLAGLAGLLRAELDRGGLSPRDLDATMGWPEGRTERLLAEPAEVSHAEARRLSARLETPMGRMLELEPPPR